MTTPDERKTYCFPYYTYDEAKVKCLYRGQGYMVYHWSLTNSNGDTEEACLLGIINICSGSELCTLENFLISYPQYQILQLMIILTFSVPILQYHYNLLHTKARYHNPVVHKAEPPSSEPRISALLGNRS